MKIFYLTTTGNNLQIAKTIGGELYSIPKVLSSNEREFVDDSIGIIFPCYGSAIPKQVKQFLSEVKLNTKYLFAIASYGNGAAGILSNFKFLLDKNDIKIDYLNSILMIDNAVHFFDMKKQIENIDKKNIDANLNVIASEVRSGKKYIKKTGFVARKFSSIFKYIYPWLNRNFYKRLIVQDECNLCGICKKVCPNNNIILEEKPIIGKKCIGCFACTHNCPQNAIRVKGEKSTTRYRNSHVTLAEIIKSNDV